MSECHQISFLGMWNIMKWFIVFYRIFLGNSWRKSHVSRLGLGFKVTVPRLRSNVSVWRTLLNHPSVALWVIQTVCRLRYKLLSDKLVLLHITSSVQFNLFNSSQRKSHWKASLKRWVLSPARNWLRLMDGERRWSGSEFQTTGAAMKKLRLPSLVVLVRETNRSPGSAERRPGPPELWATVQTMLLK